MKAGWIKIKDMHLNLDQISGVKVSEDDLKFFAQGTPLAMFQKGLGNGPGVITTEEFERVTALIEERTAPLSEPALERTT